MMKSKEIIFRSDMRSLTGQRNGIRFTINYDQARGSKGLPAYCVSASDLKGNGRSIHTGGYRYFNLDDAKAFCQAIAAGEVDLNAIRAEQAAIRAKWDNAACAHAVEQAKEFRAELKAVGITYVQLLDLSLAREAKLSDQAHRLLLEWETGSADKEQDAESLYRRILANIDCKLYGEKSNASSGPFQQDMTAYIMKKAGLNTAQAARLFIHAFVSRPDLPGVLRYTDELLDLLRDMHGQAGYSDDSEEVPDT